MRCDPAFGFHRGRRRRRALDRLRAGLGPVRAGRRRARGPHPQPARLGASTGPSPCWVSARSWWWCGRNARPTRRPTTTSARAASCASCSSSRASANPTGSPSRRKARKPSERSERPATEGNEWRGGDAGDTHLSLSLSPLEGRRGDAGGTDLFSLSSLPDRRSGARDCAPRRMARRQASGASARR